MEGENVEKKMHIIMSQLEIAQNKVSVSPQMSKIILALGS